jgi:MFS family permease
MRKETGMDSTINDTVSIPPENELFETGKGIGGWLNRNVLAFGLTSMLGDICHEMATAVLPQFMRTIGAGAAMLGLIEGIADALSSFVKLGAGFHSDKIGHRKAWAVVGYALTAGAKALFAFAMAWPLILVGRVLGWFGRGIRGPLRDAMLADSVAPHFRGRAFGFHRAGDTIVAVVGPLLAFWLLGPGCSNATGICTNRPLSCRSCALATSCRVPIWPGFWEKIKAGWPGA